MSDVERELINVIRENDNPERALEIAVSIILGFLEQCESSQEPAPACLAEPS